MRCATALGLASDLSIGLSTLGKWIASISDEAKIPAHDADFLRENERLRKENRILREEREIFEKGCNILRGSKALRFRFITDYRGFLSRSRICRLMGVTDRGLRVWKRRPPSLHQRRDLILLTHIRERHRLCLGSDIRPRMTEELKGQGFQIGQRRVGRLMRHNNIAVV